MSTKSGEQVLSDGASTIREALNAGLNAQALDLARGAVADAENSSEIRYLGALASVRMGAIDEAERWLAEVDRESLGNRPLAVEVWSLAGRIAKERFAATRDRTSAAARDFARKSIDSYEHAFALSSAAYPAVNAATMAMLTGDSELAMRLAERALSIPGTADDHWHHATAGEALLVLGRPNEAHAHYAKAYRLAGNKFGDISSMRRQLLLMGSSSARELAEALPPPQVIAFSGHMIDHPSRASPRFPAQIETRIAAALRERIAKLGPSIGYAQAACGADILFLEAMQDAGNQTQIVLPFPVTDFIKSSVSFAGAAWIGRFERVVAKATRVVLATEEGFLGDDVLFEHAANLIQGMAYLRAMELSAQPLMLTVLERGPTEAVGGTAATARNWQRKGGRIENIDVAALRSDALLPSAPGKSKSMSPATAHPPQQRMLKSLLFADISGFSRMPEQYAPDFAQMFLGTCKRILDAMEHQAVHANTHGDGLFLVFDQPSHAAEFAFRLQQAIGEVDWPAMGLAAETGVRIALHTGPLFRIFDPVTARFTFYGTHVNRTARLEPVVQPRHIFVTEEFAASLVAEDQDRFTCDYIGTMKLAKQFGDARLYRLRLSNAH
jgi:class 3 adenylate cyclase/tetratricopeptide (TPR) repeat protein